MTPDDIIDKVVRFLALLPALTFHEFAHAYSAYRLGDPTPQMEGRVSLNPLAHLDPIGTLMILFSLVGWAKPVRVNPYNFRHPERDLVISTACGPLANLAQGVAVGLVVRAMVMVPALAGAGDGLILRFLMTVVIINFALAFFNLIPLGVLDGHEVLPYFLPSNAKLRYHAFNRQYGMAVLIGLIMLSYLTSVDVLGYVLGPVVRLAFLVMGLPF
jgi:Zn-dependent protease